MAVVVLRPHTDHRDGTGKRVKHGWVDVGRPMMGHLDNIDLPAWHLRISTDRRTDSAGSLPLDVAQQHHVDALDVGGQDDRPVVGDRSLVQDSGGPPHPRRDPWPLQPISGEERLDRNPDGPGPVADGSHLEDRVLHRRGEDLTHLPAPKRPRQAVDVVGMEVGEDHGVEDSHVQSAQTAVDHCRVQPGVDEHGMPGRRGQDDAVALPDVAGHQGPASHRPPDVPRRDGGGGGHRDDRQTRKRALQQAEAQPRSSNEPEHRQATEQ